jgi:MFS transporter, ACS family, D-galactonate transporter
MSPLASVGRQPHDQESGGRRQRSEVDSNDVTGTPADDSGEQIAAGSHEDRILAVGLLGLGALCSSLCGPCAYSAAIDIGGSHVPQVFGLMNMAGNLAAAACPILVAELFQRTENWGIVLVLFAAIYILGAICWALVDAARRIPD